MIALSHGVICVLVLLGKVNTFFWIRGNVTGNVGVAEAGVL